VSGPQGTRNRLLVLVGLTTAALAIVAYLTEALREPELDSVDARFAVRGEEGPPRDLVVVGVDDVTFADLQAQWPFPRRLHARVIDRLVADGARLIAYDVQFTEPTTPRDDNALLRSVSRASASAELVLATTEVGRGGRTNVFGGDAVVRRLGAVVGNANLVTDSGGVVRQLPYSLQGLRSFSVVAAEAPGEIEVDEAEFDDNRAWIDYHGPPGTIENVPFSRVLEGRFEQDTFEDRFVVVGTTAPSLQDVHPTSVGGDQPMSGPEIQASAISTIRDGFPLKASPRGVDLALVLLFALLAPLAALALSPLRGLAIAIGAGVAYAGVVQLGFNGGLILPLVVPLVALAISATGTVTVHYVTAALERRRVRDLFARFVPESVVDQVLAQAAGELRLGGVQVEGTILFSDVRGFTMFSETQPAAQVLEVLNRYLSAMTDSILAHGGTLTAYIGDGIMAVFGAPIPQADHADRALATARAMLEVELPRFNEWVREQGFDPFEIGIGLNSGKVMAGNVGSERRLEYTAIGDAVNTASRLEGMTKGTTHSLFVADSTRLDLTRPVPLVYVDDLPVRGRRSTVKVWTLDERGEPGEDPASSAGAPGTSARP
jgi:adenylate cyclase